MESEEGKVLRFRLMSNILKLREEIRALGMDCYGDPSAIVCVKTGDEGLARMTARALPEMGLIANLVEFPSGRQRPCALPPAGHGGSPLR